MCHQNSVLTSALAPELRGVVVQSDPAEREKCHDNTVETRLPDKAVCEAGDPAPENVQICQEPSSSFNLLRAAQQHCTAVSVGLVAVCTVADLSACQRRTSVRVQ